MIFHSRNIISQLMERLIKGFCAKLIIFPMVILILLFLLSGCQTKKDHKTIVIAEQYGLAYAPVQIMKDRGILEGNTANINIQWKKMANTAAIRESMLAGNVDVGFVAIPPFLIGVDKGMKWRIISGLSMSPLGLMTYRKDINNIVDIGQDDRIALPQPGSIQHILLAMAAEREYGDASHFDNQLVSMSHPDGMNALLARREITAHFTSPPYLFKESKEKGIHQILSGKEALGGRFTFIVGVSTEEFHNKNLETYQAFLKSLTEAINFINNHPDKAADLLSKDFDLSKEKIKEYISWPGMKYGTEIRGLNKFVNFMKRTHYIESDLKATQLLWDVDLYEK